MSGDEGFEWPAGRGRRGVAVEGEVVRELGPEDLPLLAQRLPAPRQALKSIGAAHHAAARLLALGKELTEVSLITGYTISYLSSLKNDDPTFRELLVYYERNQEAVFVDVLERMKVLGLSTLAELQRRIDEEPEGWSRRELMELAELAVVKPIAAVRQNPAGAPVGGGGVQVNVQFVTAPKVIDHEPT